MSDPEPDLVTITSGDLTARINPLGAELWSLTDRLGREFMTDADPAFWSGHAPLLFPIVGALNRDTYRHDGEEHRLTKHGFARQSMFEVLEAGGDTARFTLRAGAGGPGDYPFAYPFAFVLEMRFRLAGHTLSMEAIVSNQGEDPMPFSFGFHPAFAWPLPGGAPKADHVIAFEQPEPQPVRRIEPASGLLLPEPFATPVEGHILALDPALFEADALIWDSLASRALTYGTPGATQLAIVFPDTPMLGIWQKPGANYICIEPWQGHADPVGYAGEFAAKPGVVSLAPLESRRFRMDMTVLSAD